MRALELLAGFSIRRPRLALLVAVAVTGALAIGTARLRIETAAEKFMPEDSPPLVANQMVREIFGTQEAIMVGVTTASDAYDAATLGAVAELTRRLEELTLFDVDSVDALLTRIRALPPPFAGELTAALEHGIDRETWARLGPVLERAAETAGAGVVDDIRKEVELRLRPFDDVLSLSTMEAIDSSASGLEVEPVMASVPTERDERRALRARVLSDRLLRGMLASADGTSLAVIATLRYRSADHQDVTDDLIREVRGLAEQTAGGMDVLVSGVPVVNTLLVDQMERDMARLVPFVILVLAAVLLVFFRAVATAVLPLVVVVVALVWTFGLMGFTGSPIAVLTSSMPVIVLAVGVAAALHVLAHFSKYLEQGVERRDALVRTARDLTAPIAMASLTTAVGFASLAVSELHSIRDYGLFTAFGTLAALAVTLVLLPAVLAVTRIRARRSVGRAGARAGALDRIALAAAGAPRRPARVLVPAVVLLGASIALAPRIEVGSKMTGNFDSDSEIYRAGQVLNDKFGGTQLLDIVLDTGEDERAKDPAVLAWVAGLQRDLAEGAPVGYSLSLADLIRRMNLVLHDGDPEQDRLPQAMERVVLEDGSVERVSGRDRIDQYLLLYESAGGDELARLVDFDYRRLRVMAQIRGDDHEIAREAIERAEAYIARVPPPGEVTFAGCANLCVYGDDLIVPSQIRSLLIALAVVTLLLAAVFRSIRLGLVAVAPMVVTIGIAFGAMVLLGIALDVFTALFGSIVLGIGVDYSIHLLSWYRKERLAGRSHDEALEAALAHTGRPILLNAAAVGFGFLVLVGSGYYPVRVIGAFVAAALLLSALGNLLIVSALLGTGIAEPAWRRSKKRGCH